ncbi:MAG: hypothetical protein ACJ75J_02110 [Cytophagaceae bacterium]
MNILSGLLLTAATTATAAGGGGIEDYLTANENLTYLVSGLFFSCKNYLCEHNGN